MRVSEARTILFILALIFAWPLTAGATQLIPDLWPWEESMTEDDPLLSDLDIIQQLCEKQVLDDATCQSVKHGVAKQRFTDLQPTGTVLLGFTPYNQMKYDEVVSYPGSPENERNFRLNKASLGFQGQVLFDWLSTKVVAEARPTDDGHYQFGVEYAYLKALYSSKFWEMNTVVPALGGTVGIQKIPFSRQNLTSSSELQFIRRSMVVEEMPIHYDIGATVDQVYKLFVGPKRQQAALLEIRGGAFNGQGERVYTTDNNDNMMYVGRVRLDLLAPMRPGEGDAMPRYWPGVEAVSLPESDWPQVSLGASVLQNNDLAQTVKSWGLDAEVRWSGLSVSGEMITTKFEPDFSDAQVGDQYAEDYETFGWYVQGGVFVIPRHLELAARYEDYAMDLLSDNISKRRLINTTYGLNLHLATRHRLKLMADYIKRDEIEGMEEVDNDSFTIQAGLNF